MGELSQPIGQRNESQTNNYTSRHIFVKRVSLKQAKKTEINFLLLHINSECKVR